MAHALDRFVVVMGVTGCGKSTVGRRLADTLSCPFYDADDFHPPENVKKMASGQPLNDADRVPWLSALNDLIVEELSNNMHGVLACSALKERYRGILTSGVEDRTCFLHLNGDFSLIRQRLDARKGHFMPSSLLESQFAVLEQPVDAIVIDAGLQVDKIVEQFLSQYRVRYA